MRRELRSDFTTRQTMLEDRFELYYYNDPDVKNIAAHSHNYYEFYLFLEGNVKLRIESEEVGLKPGDIVVLPPGVRHRAVSARQSDKIPYRRFVFWVSAGYLEELCRISGDFRYLADKAESGVYTHHLDRVLFQEVQSSAVRLLEEMHTGHYGKESFLKLYSADLILTLTRLVYENENRKTMTAETDVFQNMLAYIDENLTSDLSLDELAAHFYISKSAVVHNFKNRLGTSVHQYIVKKRLIRCRDAILSGEAVSAAYIACGFHDYSNFYKAFRREFGCSPREYAQIHTLK